MAVAQISWLQVGDAVTQAARLSWLQIDGGPAVPAGQTARLSWLQIDGGPVELAPAAPTVVEGDGTGETTGTITWVNNSGGSHRVQIESPLGSNNWIDATGSANPTAAGVASFAVTGLAGATDFGVRVRAEGPTLNSAYVVGTSFGTDNVGGGGGVLPPPTPVLAISATMDAFISALSAGAQPVLSIGAVMGDFVPATGFTVLLGFRGDSLTAAGASGNYLLPLVNLPAQNADLFRGEFVSSSFPPGALTFFADGRYIIAQGTPNGSYSLTFRWYLNDVAQTPLVTQAVFIGPSGALSISAAIADFISALDLSVPVAPALAINASLDDFVAVLSAGTVPSLSIAADMGSFTTIMSMLGELSGSLPQTLSQARQYMVNPDRHLDTYSIERGNALTWEKDPQSHLDYSVNWSQWLADVPGDAIANMYVTKTDGIAVTSQGIVGGDTTAVMAKEGVVGVVEEITMRISTTKGRADERTVKLLIRQR